MFSQEVNYLAGKPDGKIQAKKSTRAVGNLEVVVKVSHSGLCGTDVHDVASGCGLGHEGVGHVRKIGESVTAVKIGQRVGWGYVLSFDLPTLLFPEASTQDFQGLSKRLFFHVVS